MGRFNCYGQASTRAPRKHNVAELVRPAAPAPGDLAAHQRLHTYLWNLSTAPDADAATRNAAAIECRAVYKAIQSLRSV